MNLSLKSLEEAVGLRRQIETLEARLGVMFGQSPSAPTARRGQKGRTISAAHRAKLSAAAKARWAKRSGATVESAPQVTTASKGRKSGGGLSAAGRKKLSEMMKARWAARGKGAAKAK